MVKTYKILPAIEARNISIENDQAELLLEEDIETFNSSIYESAEHGFYYAEIDVCEIRRENLEKITNMFREAGYIVTISPPNKFGKIVINWFEI